MTIDGVYVLTELPQGEATVLHDDLIDPDFVLHDDGRRVALVFTCFAQAKAYTEASNATCRNVNDPIVTTWSHHDRPIEAVERLRDRGFEWVLVNPEYGIDMLSQPPTALADLSRELGPGVHR